VVGYSNSKKMFNSKCYHTWATGIADNLAKGLL